MIYDTASIGDRIYQARVLSRLSQREVGELLDPPVHQGTVSNWERGEIPAAVISFAQLADVLGVSLDSLVGTGRAS